MTDRTAHNRAVGDLLTQVKEMIEESGNPTGFDAAAWLARWLNEPLAALGGKCPSYYLDTPEGRDRIALILRQMQGAAYN